MSNADLDAAKNLGRTGIKKYWRRAGQVEIELVWLRDWIPALATFVKHSRRRYDNEEVTEHMKVKRDPSPEWVSSFFFQLHGSIQCWKIDGKDISDITKMVKEHVRCSMVWGTSGQPRRDHPERFTLKDKPVTYTGAFVEFYNWRNRGQAHGIHGMIELEKMHASTTENPRNLGTYWIINISSVLCSAHVVLRDQDEVVFYVNNYIDWDQHNQLYNPWMEKGVRDADSIAHKLGLALTKATNQRLEVAREEIPKKEEMVEKWKAEAMAVKRRRARGGISLSSEKEGNYESDIGDETDPDQANDEYPLQL